MKYRLSSVVLSCVFLLGLSATTQAETSAEIKIGTLNLQKALNEVDQGKRAKDELKQDFDAKQKKLDLMQQELKKKQEELQKKGPVVSDEARVAMEKSFQEDFVNLNQSIAKFRQDLAAGESKMTAVIISNLREVVGELGKEGGFDLIVESSQDTVLYAQTQTDLTDKAIKAYNKKFKGKLQY